MFPDASALWTDRIFVPANGIAVNDQLEAPRAPAVTGARPATFEPLKILLMEKITFVSRTSLALMLVNGALVAVPANTGASVRALGFGDDMEIPGGETVKTVTEPVKAPQTLLMTSA